MIPRILWAVPGPLFSPSSEKLGFIAQFSTAFWRKEPGRGGRPRPPT